MAIDTLLGFGHTRVFVVHVCVPALLAGGVRGREGRPGGGVGGQSGGAASA